MVYRPNAPAHNLRGRRFQRAFIVCLALIAVGFTFRFWIASITDNSDGRTLAWGSSFVVDGSANPYRDVVSFPQGDPIPLNTIHSLSLAQGYLGVLAGAATFGIGEVVGASATTSPPNGHLLSLGDLIAYKASYVLADLAILAVLFWLYRGRSRVVATAIWALSPLVFFAYGQGLPDLWVVAIVLASYALLRSALAAASTRIAAWAYLGAGSVALAGALSTKLLPLICLIPVAKLVASDERLHLRQRLTVLGGTLAAGMLAFLPYLFNPFAFESVFVRFEFSMLSDAAVLPVVSAAPRGAIATVVVLAVSWWLCIADRPGVRLEAWFVTTITAISLLSGIISHLMIWSLAAALIAVRTSERTAVFLTVATGFLATWHVLTYAWVSGIVGAALAPDRPTGIARDWIERNLPGAEFLGQAISSLVIVAVGALVLAHLRPEGGLPRLRRTGALVALPISGLVFAVGMVGATLAGAASGLSVSGPEAALTKAGAIVQQTPFELKPVGNWTSEPLTESGTVDQAALRVHVNSQPGLEDLELRLEKGGRVLASAKEALWRLDPESEQGTVTLNFDRQAQVHGARLVIRRIALPGSRSPEGLDPIVYLEGVSGEVIAKDGTRRVVSTPSVDLRAGQLAAIGPRVRNALLSPTRLLGPPLAGLSIAALILLISLLLPRRRGAPASAQGLPPSRSESIQTRRS